MKKKKPVPDIWEKIEKYAKALGAKEGQCRKWRIRRAVPDAWKIKISEASETRIKASDLNNLPAPPLRPAGRRRIAKTGTRK